MVWLKVTQESRKEPASFLVMQNPDIVAGFSAMVLLTK